MMAGGNRITLLMAAAMLFAGCASSPEVKLVGNGRYMISGTATGPYNAGGDTLIAAKAAKDYCAKQSKRMVVRNIEDVNLTFSCELPPQKS